MPKVISRISDTGCGMSESFLEHIFEPFAQEQNSLVNARQGTGLGLAIAKAVATTHKGQLEVLCYQGLVEFKLQIPLI